MAQNSTQQGVLYGPADNKGTTRFQVLGDGRRMYPIYMAGGQADYVAAPHKIVRGGTAISNMMPKGDTLYSYGNPAAIDVDPGVLSLRLGTPTDLDTTNNVLSGYGNIRFCNSFPFAVRRLDSGLHHGLMFNGEAFFRDTQPTVPQLGCAAELFTVTGTVGTVTVNSATITGVGSNFASAVLPAATYATYTPSLNIPRSGDIIRINKGGLNYYHRIISIASDLSLDIFPKWGKGIDNVTSNGAASAGPGAGLTYAISRTGWGSYSRIVSVYRDAAAPNDIFYNYYVGNHFSRALPGTIQCFTREASGSAASSHFMCPQNSAAADIKAQDIVMYKSYLLYGYGSTIGWSVSGFPNDFTTGFKNTDFPAANITVVANEDQFVSFELLGDQLLAFFRNSVWEVQKSQAAPFEFEFYRLPENVGAHLVPLIDYGYGSAAKIHKRPTASGRNKVYYTSHEGVFALEGRTSQRISDDINYLYSAVTGAGGGVTQVRFDPGNGFLQVDDGDGSTGFLYNDETEAWTRYQWQALGVAPVANLFSCGPVLEAGRGFPFVGYDTLTERLLHVSYTSGGAYGLAGAASGRTDWSYTSPVISMGDDYGAYTFAGFQLDGKYDTSVTYFIYGGRTPYSLTQRDTGTVVPYDGNRNLNGKKVDDPFVQIGLRGNDIVNLVAINIYTLGVGN